MAKPVNVGHATNRDMELARIANKHGAEWSLRIILEARGCDLAISDGFALVEQECGFKNIFGCDHGAGVAFCHLPVTAARVRSLLAGNLNNGVGPTQLTAREYVLDAQRDGGAHKPGVNIATGFSVLAGHIAVLGRLRGMGAFRGGRGNPDLAYARQVDARATKWHNRLT